MVGEHDVAKCDAHVRQGLLVPIGAEGGGRDAKREREGIVRGPSDLGQQDRLTRLVLEQGVGERVADRSLVVTFVNRTATRCRMSASAGSPVRGPIIS